MITPREREQITSLFDRLATLETQPRDQDAARLIQEGLQRAPHSPYALVQTVLVQDEALARADARIRQLEENLAGGTEDRDEPRGFLDNMRDALFGGDDKRGPVPAVRPGGQVMGAPAQYRSTSAPTSETARMPQEPGRGGSFLGTAAAAAAGVIGGSLLLGGIRSAMGGEREGRSAGALDQEAATQRSPWGGQEDSDLARQAGLEDLGNQDGAQNRMAALDDDQDRGAGLFDASDVEDEDIALEDDFGDFDLGGNE